MVKFKILELEFWQRHLPDVWRTICYCLMGKEFVGKTPVNMVWFFQKIKVTFCTAIVKLLSLHSLSSLRSWLLLRRKPRISLLTASEGVIFLSSNFSPDYDKSFPALAGRWQKFLINSYFLVYIELEDCLDLAIFIGADFADTRQWTIKIRQFACDYNNLPPQGKQA